MYPRSKLSRLLAFSALLLAACKDRGTPAPPTGQLPADRINEVLALQSGVVASSGNSGLDIRGGRPDEAVTYLDGVPVQNGNRGNAFGGVGSRPITVGTNGFQEASVTTGASAPEFGNAVSGVVSIERVDQSRSMDTATLPAMLIRTGFAMVQVDSLEPAIALLTTLARRSGGYVGNTAFMGGQERRRTATLQIRVPATRFGDLQAGLASLGKVLSLNIQAQDVGEEYTDAAARLHSKRQVETRLLQLLATRTGKLSDVVELEQALEDVREEIETTEGRLRYLRNQVGLSTMTVTLAEPGLAIQEPGYHPIRDSFARAWRNFTGFIAGLIAAFGWLLPLVAALGGGVKLIAWYWKRRSVA